MNDVAAENDSTSIGSKLKLTFSYSLLPEKDPNVPKSIIVPGLKIEPGIQHSPHTVEN
jgi:hypothetical protein